MKISKGNAKNFFSKLNSKLFTFNKTNKGIIRGLILTSSIVYFSSSIINVESPQAYTFFSTQNKTETHTLNSNPNHINNNFVKKDAVEIITDSKIKNHEPLYLLNSISYKDLQGYMLNNLTEDKLKYINSLLNLEVENHLYKIPDIPDNINKEITKSAILYNLAFPSADKLFNEEDNLRKKIVLTSAMLSTVAKLETGSYKYDHREFSPTKAYGRFQITATTGSNMLMRLYLNHNFNIEEAIDLEMESSFYSMLRTYTKEINNTYKDTYKENWKKNEQTKQLEKYLSYTKRLNYGFVNALNTNLSHMYDQQGNSSEQVKEKLFYSNGKLSKHKQFTFSLKVLNFLKSPENQGVLSCFVLEEIYTRLQNKYPDISVDRLIFYTLKHYNGDKNKISYKGKKEEIRNVYAQKGKYYFTEFSEKSSLITSNDIFSNEEIINDLIEKKRVNNKIIASN